MRAVVIWKTENFAPIEQQATREEVYVIPQKELDQLIQYYKGELTENALLNKAATLAAKNMSLTSHN